MTIRTNDLSLLFGPIPSLAPSPALMSDISLVFGIITAPVLGAIAGCVAPVIINPYTTFYYEKAITAEDLTNLKLYVKRII